MTISTEPTHVLDKGLNDFLDELQRAGVPLSDEHRGRIRDKLRQKFTYEPKIGIFGKTGAGKSSLCNALFGQDVCKVSDVESCTRDPQTVLLKLEAKGLKLIDVPGVGENEKRDVEYAALYKRLLPELDAVFWVLKADERAYAQDQDFYRELVRPYMNLGKPFFIVLNQVDKIEPFREWNVEACRPGPKQQEHIERKVQVVADSFDVPASKVIPVSANEKYNLVTVIDELVYALPAEQKVILLSQTREENVSEASRHEATRGFWATVDAVVEDAPLPEVVKGAYRKVREVAEAVGEAVSVVRDVITSAPRAVFEAVSNFFSGL